VGLGGDGAAYSIYRYGPANGWVPLVLIGSDGNLVADREYKVLARVQGQRILLEVNGVQVLEHTLGHAIPFGQLGLFAWGEHKAVFKDVCVEEEPGKVFVVMQFTGFDELYADVIQPAVKDFGLSPYRADEIFGPGDIVSDIYASLEKAKIVIAEMTPSNENVYYEVGYAHALKKPTIILADESKRLPFDLANSRCIFYKNSIGGKKLVEERLKRYISTILSS